MKLAKLPLPSTETELGGVWKTDVLSTIELTTIYYQVKNEQIDGIMLVDGHDYGGLYEQKAISTGFRIKDSEEIMFFFSHSYPVGVHYQPIGEGFVDNTQTRAIVTVTISSKGFLYYRHQSLE